MKAFMARHLRRIHHPLRTPPGQLLPVLLEIAERVLLGIQRLGLVARGFEGCGGLLAAGADALQRCERFARQVEHDAQAQVLVSGHGAPPAGCARCGRSGLVGQQALDLCQFGRALGRQARVAPLHPQVHRQQQGAQHDDGQAGEQREGEQVEQQVEHGRPW